MRVRAPKARPSAILPLLCWGILVLGSVSARAEGWSARPWKVLCLDPDPCSPADEIYKPLLDHASQWLDGLGFQAPVMAPYPGYSNNYIAEISDQKTTHWDVKGVYLLGAKKLYLRSDRYFTLGKPGQTTEELDFQHEMAFQLTPVHELFHAVQSRYQHLDELSSAAEKKERDWIWEGTAAAVQVAYAEAFSPEEGIRRKTRSFAKPLHRPDDPDQIDGGMRGTWIFWHDVGRQIGSPATIAYLKDILAADLRADSGIEGVDNALPRGLRYHLVRFYAELQGDFDHHFDAQSQQASLPRGEGWKVHRFPLSVPELAGQGVKLAVNSSTDKQVDVHVTLEPNDAVFHLIVDGQQFDSGNGPQRNHFRERLEGGTSKNYRVIVANVAENAATTVPRNVTLKVELQEVGTAWVELDGERFVVKPGICNAHGVVVMPEKSRRSLAFTIMARNGSTRVAWGGAGLSASIFAHGCELSAWPPCKAEGSWNAGGPRPAGNPPTNFRVEMNYDAERRLWSGAGTVASQRYGIVPIEFSVQCPNTM